MSNIVTEPTCFKLPPELWIQILREVEDYGNLKKAGRICKKLHKFIQGTEFDDALFRSKPPVASTPVGTWVALHPLIDQTDGIFTSLATARVCNYESGECYSPKDFPSILNHEFATSPATSEIIIKFCGSKCRPLVVTSGITVGDFLVHVGKYWSTPMAEELAGYYADLYNGVNEEDVTYIHGLGDHNGWTGWEISRAQGENSVEIQAGPFDS